jgi:hypothetical protein
VIPGRVSVIFSDFRSFFFSTKDYLGFECTDGSRLHYKINGLACVLLSLGGLVGSYYFGFLPNSTLQLVVHQMLQVAAFSQFFHTLFSVFLYFKGVFSKGVSFYFIYIVRSNVLSRSNAFYLFLLKGKIIWKPLC